MRNSTATKTPRRHGFLVNTTMNGAAQAASVFSTLVFFPLVMQAFGPESFGLYVIATSVVGFAYLFDLGVGISTVRLVAARYSSGDRDSLARVVSSSGLVLAGLGLVMALAISALALVSGSVFNVTPDQAELLTRLLFVGAGMQLIYWPASVATHTLNGLERYDLTARTTVFNAIASVAIVGIVLVTGSGPVELMMLGAAVMVIAAAMNALALYRVRPTSRLLGPPSLVDAREITSRGIPVFFVSLAQFLNKEQVDRLVIAVFVGPAAVAVYEVAAKLSVLITQIAGLPTSALLPIVSAMAERDDRAAMRDLFLRGGRYVALTVAPVVVALAVLAGPFIGVWFGDGFQQSTQIAHLLILAQLSFVPLLVGDPILTATGRISSWVPWAVLVALVNLGLSIAFVGALGPTGVALGTLVASLVELPLFARLVLRETGVSAREWLHSIRYSYLLLPLTAVLAFGLARTALGTSLLGIIAVGAVSVIAYFGAAWALILSAEERVTLRRSMRLPF